MKKLTSENLKKLGDFNKKMKYRKDLDVYSVMHKSGKPLISKNKSNNRAPSIAPKSISKAPKKSEPNTAMPYFESQIKLKSEKIKQLQIEKQKLTENLNEFKNDSENKIQEKDSEIERIKEKIESNKETIKKIEEKNIPDLRKELEVARGETDKKNRKINELKSELENLEKNYRVELNRGVKKLNKKEEKIKMNIKKLG